MGRLPAYGTTRAVGAGRPDVPAHPSVPLHDSPPDLAQLTAREQEVLGKVGSGLSNTEIAAVLHISEATVKTHVGHIMAKLGLRDRIQAVVYAYENGLIARNPMTSAISQEEQPMPARPDPRGHSPTAARPGSIRDRPPGTGSWLAAGHPYK